MYGNKAVFLDRDGVINRVVYRDGRPESPRSLEEFQLEDGVIPALVQLKGSHFKLFVVTNQPDVARGLLPPETAARMTAIVMAQTPLDDFRSCMHDDRHGCECRKPKPGMIRDLARKWRVDLAGSYLIGDSWKDTEAAKAAGCRSIILDRAYNQNASADYRFGSVEEAATFIMSSSI